MFEVAKGKSPKRPWVLDADLAGAFDRIAHDHILNQLGTSPARGMIRQWLKAGVVEQGRLHRTEEGTPQGGVRREAYVQVGTTPAPLMVEEPHTTRQDVLLLG